MIIKAKDGIRGVLIDVETNQVIRKVISADLETGIFEAYQVSPDGEIKTDGRGDYLTYRARARCGLKFIPTKNILSGRKVEETKPPHLKRPHKKAVRVGALFGGECEHYACSRTPEWAVSDEVTLPPVQVGKRRFGQARVVDVHLYCAFHYQPPRLLDDKGEEIKKFEDAGGVRPQWHS